METPVPFPAEKNSGEASLPLFITPRSPDAETVIRAATLCVGAEYDAANLITDPIARAAAEQEATKLGADFRVLGEKLRDRRPEATQEPVIISGERLEKIRAGLALIMGSNDDTTHRAEELLNRSQTERTIDPEIKKVDEGRAKFKRDFGL